MGGKIYKSKQDLKSQYEEQISIKENQIQQCKLENQKLEDNICQELDKMRYRQNKQSMEILRNLEELNEKDKEIQNLQNEYQKQNGHLNKFQSIYHNYLSSQEQISFPYDEQILCQKLEDLQKEIKTQELNQVNKFQGQRCTHFASFLGRVRSGKTWLLNKLSGKIQKECCFQSTQNGLNISYYKDNFCNIDTAGSNALNERKSLQYYSDNQFYNSILNQFLIQSSDIIFILIQSPATLDDYDYVNSITNHIKFMKKTDKQQHFFIVHNFDKFNNLDYCTENFKKQVAFFENKSFDDQKNQFTSISYDQDKLFYQHKINQNLRINHFPLTKNSTDQNKNFNENRLNKVREIYQGFLQQGIEQKLQKLSISNQFTQYLNLNLKHVPSNTQKFQQQFKQEQIQTRDQDNMIEQGQLPVNIFGEINQNSSIHYTIPQFTVNENEECISIVLQFSSSDGYLNYQLIKHGQNNLLNIQGEYQISEFIQNLRQQLQQSNIKIKNLNIIQNNLNSGFFEFSIKLGQQQNQLFGEIKKEEIDGLTQLQIQKISLI